MRSFSGMVVLAAVAAIAVNAAADQAAAPPATAADAEAAASELIAAMDADDVRGIARMLAPGLATGGLWFPDRHCRVAFDAAGPVALEKRRTLARCLARQTPILSTRKSSAPSGAVLALAPGVEIEVAFTGDLVHWIATPRSAAAPRGPTLTAQAFEALRIAGSTLLDEVLRPALRGKLGHDRAVSVWLEICLDERGAITSVTHHGAPTREIGDAFVAATVGWEFRPFALGGRDVPACSFSLLTYPAARAPNIEVLPPTVAIPVASEHAVTELGELPGAPPTSPDAVTVPPSTLERLRTAGTSYIDPDTDDRDAMIKAGKPSVSSRIRVCLDSRGRVSAFAIVKPSGFAGFDLKLLSAIRGWRFKPYMVNNAVRDVCTVFTFMVTPDPTMNAP